MRDLGISSPLILRDWKLVNLDSVGELEEGLTASQPAGGRPSTFLQNAALYATAGVGLVLLDAVWMLLLSPRLGLNYFDVSGSPLDRCRVLEPKNGPSMLSSQLQRTAWATAYRNHPSWIFFADWFPRVAFYVAMLGWGLPLGSRLQLPHRMAVNFLVVFLKFSLQRR